MSIPITRTAEYILNMTFDDHKSSSNSMSIMLKQLFDIFDVITFLTSKVPLITPLTYQGFIHYFSMSVCFYNYTFILAHFAGFINYVFM